MNQHSRFLVLACLALGIPIAFLLGQTINMRRLTLPAAVKQTAASPHRSVPSVSALGVLEPVGQVYLLATPVTQLGGAPRIKNIAVKEGSKVVANQILVTFDNSAQILAERNRIRSNIQSKKNEIKIIQSQTKRFEELARDGAFPVAELEEKKARLAGYLTELQELNGSLKIANERLLTDTLIRAPISGVVLKVNSRQGERPGNDAVIEMADINNMQAVAQVDEADIRLVKVGQNAVVESENGAFGGRLHGRISFVGLKVSQRKRIGIDPIIDPEPEQRVIEVRIRLDTESARKTRHLTGTKIKAIIDVYS